MNSRLQLLAALGVTGITLLAGCGGATFSPGGPPPMTMTSNVDDESDMDANLTPTSRWPGFVSRRFAIGGRCDVAQRVAHGKGRFDAVKFRCHRGGRDQAP